MQLQQRGGFAIVVRMAFVVPGVFNDERVRPHFAALPELGLRLDSIVPT